MVNVDEYLLTFRGSLAVCLAMDLNTRQNVKKL